MQTRKIVLGTNNRHKAREIEAMLGGLSFDIAMAYEYGDFDPEETGSTLEENALIKARAATKLSGLCAIADDSGLFVDALDGRPGIYAARYAGPEANYVDNIGKLLGELDGVPPETRSATIVSVICLSWPDRDPEYFRGEYKGSIALEPRGNNKFGYDPVFVMPDRNLTFAEISMEEKNLVSHRGLSIRKLKERLERI